MRDMLELLWVDPRSAPRIRRAPPSRRLLDAAGQAQIDLNVPTLPNQAISREDRHDVFLILANTIPTEGDAVADVLCGATQADGKFAPPIFSVAGRLELPFDELETLKGMAVNALPFAAADPQLRTAIDAAADFLKIPNLLSTPAIVATFVARIQEAFLRVKRAVPPGYLEAQTERALLEHRHYQKRTFLGVECLRGLLDVPMNETRLLVYLPSSVAMKLPLCASFLVRLIVEGHPLADQCEPQPFALRVLALARQVPQIKQPT